MEQVPAAWVARAQGSPKRRVVVAPPAVMYFYIETQRNTPVHLFLDDERPQNAPAHIQRIAAVAEKLVGQRSRYRLRLRVSELDLRSW